MPTRLSEQSKSRFASHETALLRLDELLRQAWNDFPQPQLCRAFGLVILKPPPVNASLKSSTDPRTCPALKGSTSTVTPCTSANKSPSRFSSNVMPYCIPEQPPSSTYTRRCFPAFSGCSESKCLICPAAFSVTETTGSFDVLVLMRCVQLKITVPGNSVKRPPAPQFFSGGFSGGCFSRTFSNCLFQ